MQIGIFETSEEASAAAARGIVDLLARKPNANLGVATGSTPEGLYSELREAHAAGRFTLEGSAAFALDEYVGIADGHPEKYRNVLRRELVGPEKTGLTEAGLRTPESADADPRLAAGQYEASIAAAGGVDLQTSASTSRADRSFRAPASKFSRAERARTTPASSTATSARSPPAASRRGWERSWRLGPCSCSPSALRKPKPCAS